MVLNTLECNPKSFRSKQKIFVFNFELYVIKCFWSLVSIIVVHVYFMAWFVFAEMCYEETFILIQ